MSIFQKTNSWAVLHDLHFLTPSTAPEDEQRLEGVRVGQTQRGEENKRREVLQDSRGKKKDKLVLLCEKKTRADAE